MEILVVCTGNVCRSPLAESLLRRALVDRGVPAHVRSAGLLSDGRDVPEANLAVGRALGVDLTSHLSRRMSAEMVRRADLVLGMAREHVREAVVLEPAAWPRSFTLKELVRRAEVAGPRPVSATVEDWLGRLGGGRRREELFGGSPDDDVTDPIGRPAAVYQAVADELDENVRRVVELLWPVPVS